MLPEFYPQLDENFTNLAACCPGLTGFEQLEQDVQNAPPPAARPVPGPPLAPTAPHTLYRAWDGTPIGYSSDCDPLTAEPQLSGVLVPDVLEENRITWAEQWAAPLLAASLVYASDNTPLTTVLWALGAYIAPYPVAIALAVPMGMSIYQRVRG